MTQKFVKISSNLLASMAQRHPTPSTTKFVVAIDFTKSKIFVMVNLRPNFKDRWLSV